MNDVMKTNPIAYQIGLLLSKDPNFVKDMMRFLNEENDEVDELDLVDVEDD